MFRIDLLTMGSSEAAEVMLVGVQSSRMGNKVPAQVARDLIGDGMNDIQRDRVSPLSVSTAMSLISDTITR